MNRVLIVLCLVFTGCAFPGQSFMGTPERAERTVGEATTSAMPELRDVVTMTRVRPTDYQTYITRKQQGQIVAEERHGNFVYFAVSTLTEVSVPSGAGDTSTGAYMNVVERFKARLPTGD